MSSTQAYNFSGVRIGTVTPDGAVVDDAGVRIGTVTSTGDVVDFAGVRIGRLL